MEACFKIETETMKKYKVLEIIDMVSTNFVLAVCVEFMHFACIVENRERSFLSLLS